MTGALQIIGKGSQAACQAADAAFESDFALEGATWSIIEEDEARGAWRIDAFPVSRTETVAFEAGLASVGGLAIAKIELADADWIALSLSGLPPVRAGRFFVHGAHDSGRIPAGAAALRIDAGAAFGTGHHGTTAGCLTAFDAQIKARRFGRVLDVGTGTGVLAIAAARSGVIHIVAADIDPVATRVAADNARLNRSRIRFARANGVSHALVRSQAPFDLVFANILAGPLISMAQEIKRVLKPGGVAILSGLLRGQAGAVRAAYVGRGFRAVRRIDMDAWTTLVLARRG